jgi:hypothetical protein
VDSEWLAMYSASSVLLDGYIPAAFPPESCAAKLDVVHCGELNPRMLTQSIGPKSTISANEHAIAIAS